MLKTAGSVLLLFITACSIEATPDEGTASTEQAVKKNTTVTQIRVNGRSASAMLLDAQGTNGFLAATEDQIANTFGLDFSWATPDATGSSAILYQGAGEIPAGAFTLTASAASLNLTTPVGYVVTRCEIDLNDGTYTCAPSGPIAFNLTWARNGLGSIEEKNKRKEVLGPVTTKVTSEYTTLTAGVNGTWGGRSSPNLTGDLTDSQSKTYIREITVAP